MTVQETNRPFEARLVTWLLIALIVWLPLQTPLAIALYQYTSLSAETIRALVLAKDVLVAIGIVVLFLRHVREIRWRWFDIAAAVFGVVLVVYSVIPLMGPDAPSLNATAAGFRQFALPIELYALGRLAATAGVSFDSILRPFLVVAAAAAIFTAGLYLLVPVTFWSSTLDLVSYEREVQGLPQAHTLADISLAGNYGQATGDIGRAVGPFTHPVGTAAYFVLPLALAFGALYFTIGQRRGHRLLWAAACLLFLAPIVFSISRGGWIAAAMAIVIIGLALRQVRLSLLLVAAFAAFVWFVPPFSVSLHSALNGTDGSAVLHQQAVEQGVSTVGENLLGSGVGRSDYQFGASFGGSGNEGTLLENTYLSLFVGVGPLGLAAFMAWVGGVLLALWPGRSALRVHWPRVALIAAMLGFAVASLTSATLLRFTTGASFWILIGLMIGHLPWPAPAAHRVRSAEPGPDLPVPST